MPETLPIPLIPRQNNPHATKAMQRAVLNALRQTGTYKAAAELIGIAPLTITRWCQKSPEFRALADEACDWADKYVVGDAIRSVFHQRAIAGKADQQSAVIGMFMLKKADPRYRDNAVAQLTINGPVAVQLNFGASPQLTQAAEHAEESKLRVPRTK